LSLALDFRTLSLAAWFLALLFAFGLYLFARSHPSARGLSTLSVGFAAIGVGYILLGLRGSIDAFSSIVVANTLIYAGHCAVVFGLFRLLTIDAPRRIAIAVACGVMLVGALTYFTFAIFEVNARIIVYSLAIATICLIGGHGLATSPQPHGRLSVVALAALFLVTGAYHLFRVVWTALEGRLLAFMDAGWVHGVTVIEAELLVLFSAFAALWIVSDQLRHELPAMPRPDPLTQLWHRRQFDDACEGRFYSLSLTHL